MLTAFKVTYNNFPSCTDVDVMELPVKFGKATYLKKKKKKLNPYIRIGFWANFSHCKFCAFNFFHACSCTVNLALFIFL